MRVVEPITITDAMLVASTIPENDYDEWDIGDSYIIGERVIVPTVHRIYEAIVATTGDDPTTDDGTIWLDIGATNRWKAFDKLISDPVVSPTDIIYQLEPGTLADSVALFGINATSVRIVCVDDVEGVTFDITIPIQDNNVVIDGYTYVFEPIKYDSQYIVSGLPIYTGVTVYVHVISGGPTSLGQIVLGRDQELGITAPGTSVSIEDFSRKDRDQFGNAILVERAFAQMVDFQFSFPTSSTSRVAGILTRLRSTPAVYYAGNDTSQFGTTVYGFYRDFNIPLTTNVSFATLEVEGLT